LGVIYFVGHKREWKNFHRYGLHMVTLEDGTRFGLGIVSCPINFAHLELGYVYKPDGTVVPMQKCDLKLYEHGEDGTPPLDYAFNFWAGKNQYTKLLIPKFRVSKVVLLKRYQKLSNFIKPEFFFLNYGIVN
jgi:hypothetical protein